MEINPRELGGEELTEYIKSLPCVVCKGKGFVDVDHIKTKGSGGQHVYDNVWPLCRGHHSLKHSIGLTDFVSSFNYLEKELKERSWEFSEFSNKWIRLAKAGWDD